MPLNELTEEYAVQAALQQIKELVPRSARDLVSVDSKAKLVDLGLSSMSKIALVFHLEEKFKVKFSSSYEEVAEIQTVQDVLGVIREVVKNDAAINTARK